MSTRTRSSAPRPLCALLFALATLAPLSSPASARADDAAMAAFRERFKAGMDRYKAGDLPSAIASWESIYREVGPEKGYRVAFDLARAYEKSGDEARAGDRYDAFVQVVEQRRRAGIAIEPVVLQEETEARARLAEIARARAAVETVSPPPPETAPVPVVPPPPAFPPAASPPAASAPAPLPALAARPPAPEAQTQHPFSPAFLALAGGAAVVAIAVTTVEYANALSEENAFHAAAGQSVTAQIGLKASYDRTVPIAYGALGASVGLAAITAGLSAWYLAGTRTREPAITPALGPLPGGAEAGIAGRF